MDANQTNTERVGIGSRYSAGKPAGWWHAPLLGLRLVAPVWQSGAEKYAPMDWREGQSFSSLIDCAMRHMLAVVDGGPLARDPESGHYHAAHAAWNLLTLLTFVVLGRDDLNDVDGWRGITAADRRAGLGPDGPKRPQEPLTGSQPRPTGLGPPQGQPVGTAAQSGAFPARLPGDHLPPPRQ